MRPAHPVEREVGVDYYVSDTDGTGGRLRATPAAFRVRELEAVDAHPVDADPDDYPHLVVRARLRNWETADFADALSNKLGISRERVSWAGTKDRHAITTQLFSVGGIDPDDLPELPRASVETVGRTGRPVLFGDLAGNEFEVRVTDPERPGTAAETTAQLRAFAGGDRSGDDAGGDPPDESVEIGVPNFFGQQRFGSLRPVTHEVGLAIARGEWREAVLAYVGTPSEREPDATSEARAFVEESHDWQTALDRFPRTLRYERSMLHRLAEDDSGPAAFRAALEAVPTSLQRLFVNAAQSYLFNLMLSERLARGLPFDRPVAGDIVCFADSDAPEGFALPDPDRRQRVTTDRVETVTRHCERGRAFVTMPLVGTDTAHADGDPGEIERAVLERVGVAPGDFDRPGEFASTGTRRAVLVQTELELGHDPLSFSFRLPRGSYATVLLREYLKTDPEDL